MDWPLSILSQKDKEVVAKGRICYAPTDTTRKPPPSSHPWRLELGNHAEANEELEKIAPAKRTHPDVLVVRLLIYEKARKWAECIDIANALVTAEPEHATGWVHRSFALHELKRTQEAFDQLLSVADKFPKEWTIPYNLACYCTQLGRFEESATWFKKAILIDEKAVQRAGIDDPDLQPLWDSMSGSVWKKVD